MKLYSVINPPCTFCDPGQFFGNDVENILCSTLFNPSAQGQISNIYDKMRSKVNSNIFVKYLSKNYIELYPLISSSLNKAVSTTKLQNNGNVYAGHDLPVWLNDPEKADVKIMIVSQDPRRSDEEMNANGCTDLGISTPWGIHSHFWRSKKDKGLLFHVAMNLIDMCAKSGKTGESNKIVESCKCKTLSVYFTDVYKFRKVNPSSIDTKNANLYASILNQEIGIVKPDIILAVGEEAHKMVPQSNHVLNLPHPNARQNTWRSDKYGYTAPNLSASSRGDYYIDKIVNLAKKFGIC